MLARGQELKQKKQELKEQKYELQDKLSELNDKIQECESLVKELNQKIAKIQQEINQLDNQIANEDRRIIQLRCDIEASMKNKMNEEECINLLQTQIMELQSKIRNLESSIENLIQEYNQNKLSAANLAKQILDIQSQLARLNQELEGLKSQIAIFQQRLQKLRNPNQRKELQDKIDALKKDLISKKGNIVKSDTKMKGLKQFLDKKQRQVLNNSREISLQKKDKNEKLDYAAIKKIQEKRRQGKVRMQEQHSKNLNQLLREANNRRSDADRNKNQKIVDKQAAEQSKNEAQEKLEGFETERRQVLNKINQVKEEMNNTEQELRNIQHRIQVQDRNVYQNQNYRR